VEDAAAAFVGLLDSDVLGPVNIASGKPVAVKDLVLTLGELCGRPDLVRLGALPMRTDEPAVIVGDVTRLHAVLGWRQRWSLREGLESTVRWWARRRGALRGESGEADR
jgi:nucleoside-diphosphate-sugar epimerase